MGVFPSTSPSLWVNTCMLLMDPDVEGCSCEVAVYVCTCMGAGTRKPVVIHDNRDQRIIVDTTDR